MVEDVVMEWVVVVEDEDMIAVMMKMSGKGK